RFDPRGPGRLNAARRGPRRRLDPGCFRALRARHCRDAVCDLRFRACSACQGARRLIGFLGEAKLEGGSDPALFLFGERTKAAAASRSGLHCHGPKDELVKRVPQSSLRSRWSTPSASPSQGDNETWITSFLKSRRPPPVAWSR